MPRTAERLVACPAGIGDRLVSGRLREREHAPNQVHVVLGLAYRPGSTRTGVDPEPEQEPGQLPPG